jgi:hypothetical protein
MLYTFIIQLNKQIVKQVLKLMDHNLFLIGFQGKQSRLGAPVRGEVKPS